MVRDSGLSFYSRKKKVSSNLFIEIFTWIFGVVFAVFLAGVLVYFFGMTTRVVGESMEPTLYNEQTVLIDRLLIFFLLQRVVMWWFFFRTAMKSPIIM